MAPRTRPRLACWVVGLGLLNPLSGLPAGAATGTASPPRTNPPRATIPHRYSPDAGAHQEQVADARIRAAWRAEVGNRERTRQPLLVRYAIQTGRTPVSIHPSAGAKFQSQRPGESEVAPRPEIHVRSQPRFWAAWVLSGDPGDLGHLNALPAGGLPERAEATEPAPVAESGSVPRALLFLLGSSLVSLSLLAWFLRRLLRPPAS
jgi:hypothetical protein